jgi:hypothetical protein
VKTVLETVALYSNRPVAMLYPDLRKRENSFVTEQVTVADAKLRQMKMDIQEYADRLLSPYDFFESQISGGAFTAAFKLCLEEVKRESGKDNINLEMLTMKTNTLPRMEFHTHNLIEIIRTYADFRGNIDNSNRDFLKINHNDANNMKGFIRTQEGNDVNQEIIEFNKLLEKGFKSHLNDVAPISLFDIGLLGGLHPRTYAVMNNQTVEKTEDFFTKAMDFYETFLAPEDGTQNKSILGADISFILFSIPLPSPSSQENYTNYMRTKVTLNPKPAVHLQYFGPNSSVEQGESGTSDPLSLLAGGAEDVRRKTQPKKNIEHNFFLACLQRGVELYIRVTWSMIHKHLEELRASRLDPDFLRPFSKYVGLVMQRAELQNPQLPTNISVMRKRLRDVNYAIVESRMQLGRACNYEVNIQAG